MMKKIFLITATIVLLFSGCAQKSSDMTSGMSDVNKAIASAQMKYNAVHKQHIAWGNTKSMIVKAKKLAAEGKDKEALKLANMAAYEADTAMAESLEAEKTWQAAVPK
jgi:CelD/BcsL family acetyltransferase involved in cellulose biosynthesis